MERGPTLGARNSAVKGAAASPPAEPAGQQIAPPSNRSNEAIRNLKSAGRTRRG